MTSETDSGNLTKLLSGEPLTFTELLQLSIVPELETTVLDLILSDQVKLDEYSDTGPDFLRTLYISCLLQVNISKTQVEAILEYALSDGEPLDVFSYWWEVIELTVASKQLSDTYVQRVAEEIALFDYEDDEEIPPELQMRLLALLLSSYSMQPKIEKRVQKRLSTLDE